MKKRFVFVFALVLLCSLAGCGSKVEQTEDTFQEVIATDYSGITLLLEDGTVIKPGEDAIALANCAGATVLFNQEPVTDFACDVNGLGTENLNSECGWFKCETNDTGKLYLWVLDSVKYVLTVEVGDTLAIFDVDASAHDIYSIPRWGTNIHPGGDGYSYASSTCEGIPQGVFYKGEPISDYEVVLGNEDMCTCEILEDGSISMYSNYYGHTTLTILANGESRTYCIYCDDERSAEIVNPFVLVRPIDKEKLGQTIPTVLDPGADVKGTDTQKERYASLANQWNQLNLPKTSQGLTITWDDAQQLVDADIATTKGKLKTIEDCLLYLTVSEYVRSSGDLQITDGKITWHFNYSPISVYSQNSGNCGGTAALICYLLDGDYDEVGYIGMTMDKGMGGHVINYIKDGNYTYAFDVSQFCSNVEYGLNMHVGTDFTEVTTKAALSYGNVRCAHTYTGCLGGDEPIGWDEGKTSYLPNGYAAKSVVLFEDVENGYDYARADVKDEVLTKISQAR